jgi:hypothetical protein
MFKVQGGDGSLNVEPVTLNRAEGVPSLLQGPTLRFGLVALTANPGSIGVRIFQPLERFERLERDLPNS